ncbi:hypothetical protein SAY87_018199 [Trapa incisa]|uniref:glutamate carboxypeptidase II n=1 Tax=Trapa incisa TaxID=236973 RepID=A0AAN7LBQ0_9MYRT|nr:hypothetical protein SAY87_018199 [Trapa incisa]
MESGGDLPLIPSLPISWADGETIMRSLGGDVAEDDWQGSQGGLSTGWALVQASSISLTIIERLQRAVLVVSFVTCDSTFSFGLQGEQKIATIENVIGVIEGAEEPDRYVLLGNHRDAWTFGAVDPNSGTAALLEVAERFRKLQKKGWKPRRTIVLCNWDAEEYGLVGSTEWVEENREILASRAVAYLNVDRAVAGAGFHAASTPQLDQLVVEAAQQVLDPDNSSQSIYDSWVGATSSPLIDRLGDGRSDYAAFIQHVGVPSANFYFGLEYPVYHSMYDDYVWMEKFGDPMFRRNVAVASIWGLVALRLADEEFLPFNYLSYAAELEKSADGLQHEVSSKEVDLLPLFRSIKALQEAAEKIDTQKTVIRESRGWMIVSKEYKMKVRELNDRLMMA